MTKSTIWEPTRSYVSLVLYLACYSRYSVMVRLVTTTGLLTACASIHSTNGVSQVS